MAWAYSKSKEHERAARRRAEEAQREKEGREIDARIAELDRKIAYNQGRIDSIRAQALADGALREAVRAVLWAKVPGAVSGHYADGEAVLAAPDGLPDGMGEEDLDAAVLARVGFEDGDDG